MARSSTERPGRRTGKNGGAVSFDGTNDRIDVPDSSSLDLTSGMTIEAWVRPTASSSYRTIVLKEITGELAYSLYAADSDHGARPSGWVRINNVSRYVDGTGSLPLNTYTHVAVTFSGSVLAFYVNGVQARSTNVTGNIQTSTLPLSIGGNTVWGEYFQGQIDDVRIYNRALSQSEIQADMVVPVGSGGGGGADTTPPTAAVTAPTSGATVAGTVTVTANASDNVGVVGVQFRLDGNNLGTEDLAAPFSVQWTTSAAVPGPHQLTAVARDAAGNTVTSAAVGVTVNNTDTQPPSVALTAPANGTTVSGTVNLTANATDNVGVAGVRFRVDGVDIGAEDTSAPYSVTWNSGTVPNGSHSLSAIARDAAGNSTTSSVVAITVSNQDATPPTVAFTTPTNGATVSGTITLSANAADNVGVAGVQFSSTATISGQTTSQHRTRSHGGLRLSRTALISSRLWPATARDRPRRRPYRSP